ncbi:hypothetical protein QJS10_CPA02g01624 [Acorus calamus]|uniref:Ternary complex factor MIP1, leucine-zipper n=1 Tax=Acorus calamus TaxID=4465 RepID=A0AAV9FFW4_ACOCL|nr:hypothetical protein QJS10_CPA02g01624 [Acorus calamus]
MLEAPIMRIAPNLNSLSQCSQVQSIWKSKNQLAFADDSGKDSSKLEVNICNVETAKSKTLYDKHEIRSYRFQLEQKIERLQKRLQEELELHMVLQNALDHATVEHPALSCLPHDAQELLSDIGTLETTVSRLEEEKVSLHFQLTQERNERRLVEYRIKHSESHFCCSPDHVQTPLSPCSRDSQQSKSNLSKTLEEIPCSDRMDLSSEVSDRVLRTSTIAESIVKMESHINDKKLKLKKAICSKGLWNHPNNLSEEMVRCMKNIFITLSDSSTISYKSSSSKSRSPASPHGHTSSSSVWSLSELSTISSWAQSPQIDVQCNSEVLATEEDAFDPYKVREKLCWADIGNYRLAVEVSWMSVGKKQLEYASDALRQFRSLVEQLAKVNPAHLSGDERLAFWINLYNALIMHSYLAYGVPRSELKLFSLMQKAAYTVGGHSFSAAAIEYVILKMKPPVHRPQTALLLALHKMKVSSEQRKLAIDSSEPLVAFALSYGMYSSPAVRIYTPANVREELQEAQRDFIRASAGLSSKGKLLVPKMVHCFTKGSVDDANLAVWISGFLPPQQANFVEQCLSQRRQSFLSSRNCGILPFDSRFRYLFLPEILP